MSDSAPRVRAISATDNRACGIVIADQMKWARAVARGIRRHYRFLSGSQEEKDLEAVAHLMLCRCAAKFDPSKVPEGGDPVGQFRGWAHPFLRGECQREARRLRNGGTYNTRRESGRDPVMVEDLPRRRENGDEEYVDLADHRVPYVDLADHRNEAAAIAAASEPTSEADLALVGAVFAVLDPREQLTLSLRHGVGVGFCHTYREIAEVLCVTKDQVREIEAAAVAKLRGKFPGRAVPDEDEAEISVAGPKSDQRDRLGGDDGLVGE